ncbi:MAG: phosphate transport system permease protein, partial [Bradyrhizobium sp.]|nr:phosphate transport system permease protein [Bradyrhizobium sp.]
MVDVAWQGAGVNADDVAKRARVLNKLRIGDIVFHNVTKASAIFVLVVLGGVILSLLIGAWPALQEFGFGFIT